MRIAIDTMGGDNAPGEIIKGAVAASDEYGLEVILVGDRQGIQEALAQCNRESISNIDIVHTSEVIGMDESPTSAVRRKKDSSLVRGVGLVKEGMADAVLSAGNTGAVMAASLFLLGRVKGIDRPALVGVVPNRNGVTLLLDVGANANCKPKNLLQFAVMGKIYADQILGLPDPRIGLLSIGEESTKGNELTLATLPLLTKMNLNFIGNVEGHQIFNGQVDVVVCDGFTGNIVLKASESIAKELVKIICKEVKKISPKSDGAILDLDPLKNLEAKLNYREYGGSPLLGVNGVSIVCHGNSNSRAIKSAVRIAADAVDKNIVDAMRKGVLCADV